MPFPIFNDKDVEHRRNLGGNGLKTYTDLGLHNVYVDFLILSDSLIQITSEKYMGMSDIAKLH
jgi:hypothetical protein